MDPVLALPGVGRAVGQAGLAVTTQAEARCQVRVVADQRRHRNIVYPGPKGVLVDVVRQPGAPGDEHVAVVGRRGVLLVGGGKPGAFQKRYPILLIGPHGGADAMGIVAGGAEAVDLVAGVEGAAQGGRRAEVPTLDEVLALERIALLGADIGAVGHVGGIPVAQDTLGGIEGGIVAPGGGVSLEGGKGGLFRGGAEMAVQAEAGAWVAQVLVGCGTGELGAVG